MQRRDSQRVVSTERMLARPSPSSKRDQPQSLLQRCADRAEWLQPWTVDRPCVLRPSFSALPQNFAADLRADRLILAWAPPLRSRWGWLPTEGRGRCSAEAAEGCEPTDAAGVGLSVGMVASVPVASGPSDPVDWVPESLNSPGGDRAARNWNR